MASTDSSDIHLAGTTLRQQRHLCAFFHSLEERYRVLGPFVKEGIERGEKAFHVVDPARRVEHLHRLEGAGVDVPRARATGQLEVRGWDETYLRGKRFDAGATLALFGRVLSEARNEGFPLTRVVGEMGWALDEPTCGVEKLIEYEARASALFAESRDPLVCTYDRSRFGATAAMDVFGVHYLGITSGIMHPNPLLDCPIAFRRPREPVALTALRRRFLSALLTGGRNDALDIVVEEGLCLHVPIATLYLDVVQPALSEIGHLWQCDRVSVADVLFAVEISKLALAELRLHLTCEPSNGRSVVVACVEGEEHDVGAYMVADFLEAAGFDVRFLGANVPTRTLEALVEDQRPELLALSATTGGSVREIRHIVRAIRRAANGPLSIAIGGQLIAAYPGLLKNLGVIYAAHPRDLVAAALGRLDRS